MIPKTRGNKDIIGVDVGGSKIAVGLVSPRGSIDHAMVFETDVSSEKATLDCIAGAVEQFIDTYAIELQLNDAIGFGIPGLVDADRGIGIASVNLNWENVPVRSELSARLNRPCVIDNDVRVGAIGEAIYGQAIDASYFLYLNIGTGVSVVIMNDGKFFSGVHGLAGEIGHAVMIPDGPVCKCGGKGCLEAIVSGPGIALRAQQHAGQLGGNGKFSWNDAYRSELTPEQVFTQAIRGEEFALKTIREVGDILAYSLQYLALAYDPEMIVLAGGVVHGGNILIDHAQEQLKRLAEESWVFGKIYSHDLVRISALGTHAGVLGAAALVVIDNFRKEKAI